MTRTRPTSNLSRTRSPTNPFARPIAWTLALTLLVLWSVTPLAYAQQADLPEGRYRVDHDRSDIYAVTHRSGVLGFLGHEHAILATEWTAEICFRSDDPESSSVQVTVPTQMLRIDTERGRELAEIGAGPDEETRMDLQEQMLEPRFLSAEEHPEITFVADTVSRSAEDTLEVSGILTIRGQESRVVAPMQVSPVSDGVRFQSNFVIMHSQFGMEPESTAGVVSVAEEIDIFIDVVALATGRSCP